MKKNKDQKGEVEEEKSKCQRIMHEISFRKFDFEKGSFTGSTYSKGLIMADTPIDDIRYYSFN